MIPLAASWSSNFAVLRNSTSALSFSVVERTRLIAVRIFDFHTVLRTDLRFEIRALFSADLCCAIQQFLFDTDENHIHAQTKYQKME
jgi:hypothetical protein